VASKKIVKPIPTPICFNNKTFAAKKPPTVVHNKTAAFS
jgi:hypothetical protein